MRKKEKKSRKKEMKKQHKKAKKKLKHKHDNKHTRNSDSDSDSSDDIFASVSGPYVPPDNNIKAAATKQTESIPDGIVSTTKAKPSIFEGLGGSGAKDEEENAAHGKDNSNASELNRHALIAKLTQRSTFLSQHQQEGKPVGLSTYAGGYGEEMDLDFDGSLEQEAREARQNERMKEYEHGGDHKNKRKYKKNANTEKEKDEQDDGEGDY
jgi:hypothetical protein